MSRDIYISYRTEVDGAKAKIGIRAPYHLFGTQQSSKEFWSLPKLREIGLTRLIELGNSDPIYFVGWDDIAALDREITLLWRHLAEIDFHTELKAQWLAHLVYCYSLLRLTTPDGCVPELTIG
jgi:hypothetical protein